MAVTLPWLQTDNNFLVCGHFCLSDIRLSSAMVVVMQSAFKLRRLKLLWIRVGICYTFGKISKRQIFVLYLTQNIILHLRSSLCYITLKTLVVSRAETGVLTTLRTNSALCGWRMFVRYCAPAVRIKPHDVIFRLQRRTKVCTVQMLIWSMMWNVRM